MLNTKNTKTKKNDKKNIRKKRGRFWLKILFVLAILVAGLLLMVDAWVVSQFSGKKWSIPASVYARPLELYEGKEITVPTLIKELNALGYQAGFGAKKAGTYVVSGRKVTVHTKGFQFMDGVEPAKRFSLQIEQGMIESMVQPKADELPIVRLEPLKMGGIYPKHHEDRELIRLSEVPQTLIDGLVAVEDKQFYSHWGVSAKGIARAIFANIQAGRVHQGGSTLTQQLVKNFFLTSERSLKRKASEAVVSLLLELHFSKEEILEAYFNEVYLAQSGPRAIHGFGLASRYYFNLPLNQLSIHQQALLIGLVKGPSYYDPWRNPKRSKKRRNLVLKMMADEQIISESDASRAKQKPLDIGTRQSRHRVTYPAYLDIVRRQLRKEYRDKDLSTEGLQIFTHFDPFVQWQAERSVTKTLKQLKRRYGSKAIDDIEAGMVITSVDTGDVLAVVGGKNVRYAGFNRALDAVRPIGSLMKPAVFLTALSKPEQYSLITPLMDEPISIKQPNGSVWEPKNYSKKDYGEVPLHKALSLSLNQSSAKLGLDVGVGAVLQTVKELGVERELPEVPAVLLGAAEMTVFDVASMYQTIAGGGFHSRLNTISGVMDANGELLQRYPFEVEQRVSIQANYLLHYSLQEVMHEGTGRKAYAKFPREYALAGKTGTTDEQRDSWFAGFNGSQLGVVWMGRDDNRPTKLTGSSGALSLWLNYFETQPQISLLQNVPEGVEYHWVDDTLGALSEQACEGARYMPFIEGSEPNTQREPCSKQEEQYDEEKPSIWRWFQHWLN